MINQNHDRGTRITRYNNQSPHLDDCKKPFQTASLHQCPENSHLLCLWLVAGQNIVFSWFPSHYGCHSQVKIEWKCPYLLLRWKSPHSRRPYRRHQPCNWPDSLWPHSSLLLDPHLSGRWYLTDPQEILGEGRDTFCQLVALRCKLPGQTQYLNTKSSSLQDI